MTIEFHSQPGKVKEWVINYVKDKLIEFHQRNNEISKAEVYFKEHINASQGDKVCEIELMIFGDLFFVHRNAESFERASREAIKALTETVEEQIKKQAEPPDVITSTVEV